MLPFRLQGTFSDLEIISMFFSPQGTYWSMWVRLGKSSLAIDRNLLESQSNCVFFGGQEIAKVRRFHPFFFGKEMCAIGSINSHLFPI